MDIGEQDITWEVITSEGKHFDGTKDNWHTVNDNNTIQYFNIILPTNSIHLPPRADKYYQSKTASCNMDGSNLHIESHNYEVTYGDKKLIVQIKDNSIHTGIYIGLEDLNLNK